jgi:hypothetical protein
MTSTADRIKGMKMSRHELYEAYRQKYGHDEQMLKAIEELAELQVELMAYHFNRGNELDLVDEVADVKIMTEQIEWFFGIDDKVAERVAYKIARMESRLKNA